MTFLPLPLSTLCHTSEEGAANDSVLKLLGGMVMSCYAKYWIYVCGGMFIMVSFAGKLVGYKIVYMLLFLLCLCLYQVGTGLRAGSLFLQKAHGLFRCNLSIVLL